MSGISRRSGNWWLRRCWEAMERIGTQLGLGTLRPKLIAGGFGWLQDVPIAAIAMDVRLLRARLLDKSLPCN